ncbi:thioredoxin domain-containing protein [Microlunatus parietis]
MAAAGAVAVVLLFVAGSLWSDRLDSPGQHRDTARRIEGDVTAYGSVDARVVMIEYADYRCPTCAHFAGETLPLLITEYVEPGLVRYEWRDLPVLGPESFDAAVAARAAGRQGHYWAYHNALFSDESAAADREHWLVLARVAGVPDVDRFALDLFDPALAAEVQADVDEAGRLGAAATPTFMIGETPVVGSQLIEVYRQAIEHELRRAGVRR